MKQIYVNKHKIRAFGSSFGISMTQPLNSMDLKVGDMVEVSVDDNKIMTIKKVDKK